MPCPLGSRTALFLESLKFCWKTPETSQKKFTKTFFVFLVWRSPEKIFGRLFFWRTLAPVSLALVSTIPVLGLERVYPQKGCPWPWMFFVSLASSLVSLTPPLLISIIKIIYFWTYSKGYSSQFRELEYRSKLQLFNFGLKSTFLVVTVGRNIAK